jgi:hypothetical protein
VPDQGTDGRVDGKQLDPESNMGNGMERYGTNGHTIRIGFPFYPGIDFSEIGILQKRVKQFPVL